jgi:hypothetical protein
MATEKFDEGIEITLPGDFEITKQQSSVRRSSIKLPSSGVVPMPTSSGQTQDNDVIIQSLKKTGMELLKEVEIKPTRYANLRRSRSAQASEAAEFAVDLPQDEEAVLLFEQDGMYTWKYASESQPTPSVRRRGTQVEATQKRFVFRIDISAPETPETSLTKRDLLSEVKDFAWGKVKAYVWKYTASLTVQAARSLLERNVRKGLVKISSPSASQWSLLDKVTDLPLPANRAPRILLLIHGTFSNTVGAFGALGETPWGESLLESALNTYDAVLGFNHVTLGEDPLQNARQLLEALQSIKWQEPPTFDVIAHSRGGLVIRSLIEKLLPKETWQPKFNRVIFVACTNEGSLLAEPANWERFIDLYTNIAVGTCRVVGLISPQTSVVTAMLGEVIENIGSFVKFFADSTITDKMIPGLSAMEPKGEFIKDINLLQEGQPTIADSYYCAITSEFKPSLTGDHEPRELPRRFVDLLVGGLATKVMGDVNDLVVHTSSMRAIDLGTGNYIKESYDFGGNPQVYHTNYFTRPEVANVLARWLKLPPIQLERKPVEGKPYGVRTGGIKRGIEKGAGEISLMPLPTFAPSLPNIHPAVDTDILLVNAETMVGQLYEKIKLYTPSYLIVRRPYQSQTLYYAFTGEEALGMIGTKKSDIILDAFNLHESDASATQYASDEIIFKNAVGQGGPAQRAVVLADDFPVGVVPEKQSLPNAMELAKLAQIVVDPDTKDVSKRIIFRRAMPTFTVTEEPKEAVLPGDEPPPPEAKVLCQFHAEMDAEVILKGAATLVVTISRELIEALENQTSVKGAGEVSLGKKLLVQVLAKSNFMVIDESDGRSEIDVPEPNQPQELFFDLRATEEGQGEIWVVARQGQVPIIKMILRPKVVKKRRQSSEKAIADQTAKQPKPLFKPLHQLWIHEHKTETGVVYKYTLESEGLKLRMWFDSAPFLGDREKYVANLYQKIEDRWISAKQDIANFTQELRAFGVDLYDELIPKELQRMLWQHGNEFDSIQVISTEPFIPWELVHLKDPDKKGMPAETKFLGQMGLIRWLAGAGDNGWPPDELKLRNRLVRYVIPEYPHPQYKLPEAEKEREFIEQAFEATAVEPESGEVRKLISQPGAFDLLHFACHGGADSGSISDAKLLLQGRVEAGNYILDPFTATVAAKFSNLKAEDNMPMVVLNACQAGRAGYKLTGIGGFAEAFLSAGAGVFVGALWSVGDHPARTFTETLYQALLRGANLSEATIEARNAAEAAGEATWLAYAVYGHPYLIIRR